MSLGISIVLSGLALAAVGGLTELAGAVLQQPASKPTLNPADAAPALTVGTWVKGTGPKSFETGKSYAVVFWSPTNGPSISTLPRVKAVADTYGEKGLTVLAIAAQDKRVPLNLEAVQTAAKQRDKELPALVGFDDDKKMQNAWIKAAGVSIPCAFIVDGKGKIAWVGQTDQGFARAAELAAAGTLDAAKFAQWHAMDAELDGLVRKGQADRALPIVDKLLEADAGLFGHHAMTKFDLLMTDKNDHAGAAKFAAKAVDVYLKDEPEALNSLAGKLLYSPGVTNPDIPLAIKAATRSVELTGSKTAANLETLAGAYFMKGDYDKAIETQTNAVQRAAEGMEKGNAMGALKKYKDAKKKS